jgi:hypothetical protein
MPPLREAHPDLLKDQPLLGFSGVAGEVQNKQPGPVGFDRVQVEIDPLLGYKTSPTTPLKRSTGLVKAKDFHPSLIQQVQAMGLFDQSPAAMSPPSRASAATHERFPSMIDLNPRLTTLNSRGRAGS